MGVALLYPESEKGGRGNKKKVPETGGFSRQRLGDARAVLAHSPVLAKGGTTKPETGVKKPQLLSPPSPMRASIRNWRGRGTTETEKIRFLAPDRGNTGEKIPR